MRVWWRWLIAGFLLLTLLLTLVAATPGQEGRPPSPLEPDYYSGTVTVQGEAPAAGTWLLACVDGCEAYQGEPVALAANGAFQWLIVGPHDWQLVGDEVTFHIVNEYGSIQAAETNVHAAARNSFQIALSFADPLPNDQPVPTPTPEPTPVPPTPTPAPTATPTPTPAPTATPTPEPTATLTPEPTPTASLPVTGDRAVTGIPPLFIAFGVALAAAGGGLLVVASRRRAPPAGKG